MVGPKALTGTALLVIATIFLSSSFEIWSDNRLAAKALDREAEAIERERQPGWEVPALDASDAAANHRATATVMLAAGFVLALIIAGIGGFLLTAESRAPRGPRAMPTSQPASDVSN